jgi:hypothetical protein
MATRSIDTVRPDVACYVCKRHLLRGEQPEVFLPGGVARTVCELCARRAVQEGWPREGDSGARSLPAERGRRGRNPLAWLRTRGRPVGADPDEPPAGPSDERRGAGDGLLRRGGHDGLPEGLLGIEWGTTGLASGRSQITGPAAAGVPRRAPGADERREVARPRLAARGSRVEADGQEPARARLVRAVEIFNEGAHPRRVAGVARSLGAPAVSVRPVEDLAAVVGIVVAWELCWYRYEVALEDDVGDARVLAQGSELAELTAEERRANAAADELGALSLTGA